MVHNFNLNPQPFEMMAKGLKTIELRLYDEKRKNVKIGDKIVFTNTGSGQTIEVQVIKLHLFNNFKELYNSLPLKKCGYTEQDVEGASYLDMQKYYSMEQQLSYGVVGIEIALIGG